MTSNRYQVSALVSAYNSERFMRGCLDDLTRQTLYAKGQLQIVIVDSHSPQNEQAIVREFQSRCDHIVYHRTDQRESLYAAWNRALTMATGRYVTNANTDDRHRVDALERMAAVLDGEPVGLVYADSLVTAHANETFARHGARRIFRWPPFSVRQLLVCSIFGPQPMWHRAIHDELGGFDPGFVVAGDYDFFIRLAARHGARHLPEVLGLYFDGGLESQGRDKCREETDRVLRRHRRAIPLETIYPLLAGLAGAEATRARAAAWVDFGNLALDPALPDSELARHCYTEAAVLLPEHPVPANNLAVALCREGKSEHAIAQLEPIANHPTARQNLKRIRGNPGAAARLALDAIPHPVWQSLPPLEAPGSALQKLRGFRQWLRRWWR